MSASLPALESSGLRIPGNLLSPALRPYVLEIYEESIPASPAGPLQLPISAGIYPILNTTLSGRARIDLPSGEAFWMPPVLLSGPQPTAYTATCHGKITGFYVVFQPVGPLALMGQRRYWRAESPEPPPLEAMMRPPLAPDTRTYAQSLLEALDFETRAALTIQYLEATHATAEASDLADAAFLLQAVEAIEAAGGNLRIAALARQLGVGSSSLRRRFSALGISAKCFTEIVQFRQAHAFLATTPGATWADAVHRFGYADQAHFVRQYRRFSGGPPTRWDANAHAIDVRMGIEEAGSSGRPAR